MQQAGERHSQLPRRDGHAEPHGTPRDDERVDASRAVNHRPARSSSSTSTRASSASRCWRRSRRGARTRAATTHRRRRRASRAATAMPSPCALASSARRSPRQRAGAAPPRRQQDMRDLAPRVRASWPDRARRPACAPGARARTPRAPAGSQPGQHKRPAADAHHIGLHDHRQHAQRRLAPPRSPGSQATPANRGGVLENYQTQPPPVNDTNLVIGWPPTDAPVNRQQRLANCERMTPTTR